MNVIQMHDEFEIKFNVGDAVNVFVHDWYSGECFMPGVVKERLYGGKYHVEIRDGVDRHMVMASKDDLRLRDVLKPKRKPTQFQIGDAVTLVLRNTKSGSQLVAGTIKHVSKKSVQVDLDGQLLVLASLDDVRPVYAGADQ